MTEAQDIAWILHHCKTIAVVGLSPKPHRESFGVSQIMQAKGYRIIPVNPNAETILGEKVYRSLTEAAQHEQIDLVNVFRNSDDVPPVVEEAIAIGAKAVWLQLGIVNEPSMRLASDAGLRTVQDRCIKVEHAYWARG
jgi:predicted CoA-binding protein